MNMLTLVEQRRGGEDLTSVVGDEKGVLELGRVLAVLCAHGPVIGPHLIVSRPY